MNVAHYMLMSKCYFSYMFSTAVIEFLAQPTQKRAVSPELEQAGRDGDDGSSRNEDRGWDGDESDYSDESDEFDHKPTSGSGSGGSRSFFTGKAGAGRSTNPGEAVAVAALASDYGTWLRRLAVRLRRATPPGDRFVRLRRISPAITGEEVRYVSACGLKEEHFWKNLVNNVAQKFSYGIHL